MNHGSELTPPSNGGGPNRPAIYVASLSDYAAGRLHGEWLPADQEPDELVIAARAMLARSHEPIAEEWAIHDYENFHGIAIGEFDSFSLVSHLARGLRTYGPAFAAYVRLRERGNATYSGFETSYAGHYDSPESYLAEVLDIAVYEEQVAAGLPNWLVGYVQFNVAGLARDMQINGDIVASEDLSGFHVFTRFED